MNLSPFVQYYQKPEHQAFYLPGGSPSALLVHGFPGTPAEMRPLGEALHRQGWTVEGLLLPGFGEQIETLFEQRFENWVEAVQGALHRLQSQHHPTLLSGFSMGAALAIQAAANLKPDGLVLMAPFWKLRGPLWSLLPIIRRIFPTIHPFRTFKIDFSDPEMRRGMREFMPDVDLDDPQTLQGMRDFAVPVGIFDEIRKAGKSAWQLAPLLSTPALVLQGIQDELVPVRSTRQILTRMPAGVIYREIPASHDLPDPGKPAWPLVKASVLAFAAELTVHPDQAETVKSTASFSSRIT